MTMDLRRLFIGHTNNSDSEHFYQKIGNCNNIVPKFKAFVDKNPDKINYIMYQFMLYVEIKLEDFISMINLGADPRYGDDIAFDLSTQYESADIPHFLINAYGFDVSKYHFITDQIRPGTIDVLLQNGLQVDPHLINNSLYSVDKIKIIIKNGCDLNFILSTISNWNTFTFIDSYVFIYLIEQFLQSNTPLDSQSLGNFLLNCLSKSETIDITLITLEKIIAFQNAGVDMRFDNDIIFIKACKICAKNIIDYFINDIGVDINAQDSEALISALEGRNYKVIELLSENEIIITERCIFNSFSDTACFNVLKKYLVNPDLVAKLYFEYHASHVLRYLVESGVNFSSFL